MRGLFDEVETLVIPVSSAEAERSFSALRRCVHQSVFSRGWPVFSIVFNGNAAFLKRHERNEALSFFFHAEALIALRFLQVAES